MYIKSSKNRRNNGRRIVAEEEIAPQEQAVEEGGSVQVDPEATELVFETEDVAELLAEVTGEDIDVVADENQVVFTIGDTDYTVEAEGQEEILESTSLKNRRPVRANRNTPASRKPVAASTRKPAAPAQNPARGRTVRKITR